MLLKEPSRKGGIANGNCPFAEFRFSVFDILGQNQSISRNITEVYIEDTQSNLLQRYFMLTFTYTIKVFKAKPDAGQN